MNIKNMNLNKNNFNKIKVAKVLKYIINKLKFYKNNSKLGFAD